MAFTSVNFETVKVRVSANELRRELGSIFLDTQCGNDVSGGFRHGRHGHPPRAASCQGWHEVPAPEKEINK